MISARRRVELFLPIFTVTECLMQGADNDKDHDLKKCKKYLMEARLLALADLTPREFEKITRRTLRLYDQVFEQHIRVGASTTRTGLVIYHWIKKLTQSEYMAIPDGSAFDRAMKIFLQGIVEAGFDDTLLEETEFDADEVMRDIKAAGYYEGILLE